MSVVKNPRHKLLISDSFIMLLSSIAENLTVRVAGEKLAFKHACA